MIYSNILVSDLLAESISASFLRQTLQEAFHELMDADIEELCQAKQSEHSARRVNSRNGYRHAVYPSCAGEIALKIPKLRSGKYSPGIFQRRQIVEQALIAVIHESYFQGMVTRSSEELIRALDSAGMSIQKAVQVSERIDERVKLSALASREPGTSRASAALMFSGIVNSFCIQ